MKILNVNMAINSYHGGGSAERTYQMSQYFVKKGFECSVLTLDLGLTPEFRKTLTGVTVISIPCLGERFFLPSFSLKSLKKINDIVSKVDIVHIMGHWSMLNALAYIFVYLKGKPYVFCSAGTLIIHGRSKYLKLLYNWVIGNKIIRNASGYIASTDDEIMLMRANGVTSDNIVMIPNGINNEQELPEKSAEFRDKYSIGSSPFILYVATFSSIKGPDLLIKAFNKIKSIFSTYHLVFAGTNRGMLPEIKEYVKLNDLEDRVHFLGYVGGIDKINAYSESDLLVVPSRSEVISMVALEAGVLGKPVLITDKCGFNELTSIGGGAVVSASVDGIQKGLIQLLSAPDKLKEMGANLKKHVSRKYTWDVIIKRYIDFYSKIIKN